jgi:hypothetical protein
MLSNIDAQTLAHSLLAALRSTLFDNRLTVTPRHASQIASRIAQSYQDYYSHQAGEVAQALGQHLAQEGIGHASLLSMIEALHSFSWELCETQPSAAPRTIRYCSGVLAGYMAAREAHLLSEQERARVALERARRQVEP